MKELKFKKHKKLKIPRKKAVFVDRGVKERLMRTISGSPEASKRLERVATEPSKEMKQIWDINELKAELKEMRSYHKFLFAALKRRFSEEFAEAFFLAWYVKEDPFRLFEELESDDEEEEKKPKLESKPETERPYQTKEELEAYKAFLKEKRDKRKKEQTYVSMLFR